MQFHSTLQNRFLVPRWRNFASTLATGELRSIRLRPDGVRNGGAVTAARLERWLLDPNLVHSAELIDIALVEGREKDAVEAARRILGNESSAAPLIQLQARKVLERAGQPNEAAKAGSPFFQSVVPRPTRSAVQINPRDAIAWVELALQQTINGHPKAALRAMSIALALAPDNRHVLRAASRLYLHVGDPEKAHATIAKRAATKSDPWLIAAEISLAAIAEKASKHFKNGLALASSGNFSDRNLTELAGAIGTAYLLDGYRKGSKAMFAQSMVDPTGSSLAQGEWATPRLGVEIVQSSRFAHVPDPFEAEAFHYSRELQFSRVPDVCLKWADADAFSIRPFEHGSAAASYDEDFTQAEDLARKGLARKRDSDALRNTLVFALASAGRIQEAKDELKLVSKRDAANYAHIVREANQGLIAFREGDYVAGLVHYDAAIRRFKAAKADDYTCLARVYLAREAKIAGIEAAPMLLSEATNAAKLCRNNEAMHLIAKLQNGPNASGPTTAVKKLRPLRTITWTSPGMPGHNSLSGRVKI